MSTYSVAIVGHH